MLVYDELIKVISGFPHLSKIWDVKYVSEDCQNGFQHPWLNRLAEDPDAEILSELNKLENYIGKIAQCKGFNKLLAGLKAHNIGNFSSTVAEVKTDAWIAS